MVRRRVASPIQPARRSTGRLFVGELNGGVPATTVAEWAGHSVAEGLSYP
jgi:hypothetical protein